MRTFSSSTEAGEDSSPSASRFGRTAEASRLTFETGKLIIGGSLLKLEASKLTITLGKLTIEDGKPTIEPGRRITSAGKLTAGPSLGKIDPGKLKAGGGKLTIGAESCPAGLDATPGPLGKGASGVDAKA